MKNYILKLFCLSTAWVLGLNTDLPACTRLMYKGPEGTIITARSMDFSIPIPGNLWLFPRGMERTGEVGQNSISWTSRYGSVIMSSWDIGSPDGMNEKGLVANMLWMVTTEYPAFDPAGDKKGLSVSLWAQYCLDNFATVAEAVEALRAESFVVVSDVIPGTQKMTTIHLSLSDATGDNAIFEYIGGRLVIHHDPSYVVMTNEPAYEEQLAIQQYWKQIPGRVFLPGTNKASDRFVRATHYLNAIPQTADTRTAVASVFSLIRNCSVPYGISDPEFPNLSSTQWRVVADHKNLVYYYEDVLTPNVFWVDLKNLDFSEKSGSVKKLDLSNFKTYTGEVSSEMKKAKPFQFQGLD